MDYPLTEEKYKQSRKKRISKYLITFRQNRIYEMKVGNVFNRFQPRGQNGDSLKVKKNIINHPDFQTQKNLFVIKEL